MPGEASAQWLASDVYFKWRGRVRQAAESIVMFSPYLDQLAVGLLAKATIPRAKITIVTDLSPASGAQEYLGQLEALKELITQGYDVRHLERVHAKVLFTDSRHVTVGSQNFTRYARRSRETTVASAEALVDGKFLAVLQSWRDLSEPIPLELVDTLLEQMAPALKELQGSILRVVKQSEDLVEAFRREQQAVRARARTQRRAEKARLRQYEVETLRRLVSNSTVRLAGRRALATMQEVEGPSGSFPSLVADRHCDLTAWHRQDSCGKTAFHLKRLYMVPILLAGDMRLGFARVGTSRISYVSTGVRRRTIYESGDLRFQTWVEFPSRRSNNVNLKIFVRGWALPRFESYGCTILAYFNGEELVFRGWDIHRASSASNLTDDARHFFESPETLATFVKNTFSPFRYSELGIWNHTAANYFKRSRYQLELFEWFDTAFLLATPLK